MSRAKTSRAPFQVLRGAIDAPRTGAFDKPAGGVARGLSRLTPPKKRRPSEAILPSFDVAGSPARPAGTRGRLPLVLGRFCLFWSALSSSRPHTNPATDFYRSPPPHPFSRSHARDFLPFFPHGCGFAGDVPGTPGRPRRCGHGKDVTEKTGRRARVRLGCRNTPQGGRCDDTPNIGEKQARQDDLLPDKVWSPYAAGDAAGWSVRCVRASPALLFQQGEKGWSGRPTWA